MKEPRALSATGCIGCNSWSQPAIRGFPMHGFNLSPCLIPSVSWRLEWFPPKVLTYSGSTQLWVLCPSPGKQGEYMYMWGRDVLPGV